MLNLNVPIVISTECARLIFVAVFGAEPEECDENLEFECESHAWAHNDFSDVMLVWRDEEFPEDGIEVKVGAMNSKFEHKHLIFVADSGESVADAVANLKAQIGLLG